MKKVIKIENKDIEFQIDGTAPIVYRTIFGRDYFEDINKLKDDGSDNINFAIFLNFAYLMAKMANEEIGSMLEWLATFDNPMSFMSIPGQNNDTTEEELKEKVDQTPTSILISILTGNNSYAVSDHKKKEKKAKNQES